MNIITAINDSNLFKPFIEDGKGSTKTWNRWKTALRCMYGLPIHSRRQNLIKSCTGRELSSMPSNGFSKALLLTGRRSGKSRISAVCGAYEAILSGRWKRLAKGELGIVAIVAPTKLQGRIIRNYLENIFESSPILEREVVRSTQAGFQLRNGVRVEILSGDFKSVRGYTLLACICDEICFFGLDSESKIKSDTELVRAITPSLLTTKGRLICISSPYRKAGWAFQTYKKNYGNPNGSIMVWNAPSRTMIRVTPNYKKTFPSAGIVEKSKI